MLSNQQRDQLANNVRQGRAAIGLSVEDLSRRAQITTHAIDDIERSNPRFDLPPGAFARLADALRVEPSDLLPPVRQMAGQLSMLGD